MDSYKLYSRISDHETILELWAASTKHPDSMFFFSDFQLSEWFEPEDQIVPWVYECASKMNFPYHAFSLAQWIGDRYKEQRGWNDQFQSFAPAQKF